MGEAVNHFNITVQRGYEEANKITKSKFAIKIQRTYRDYFYAVKIQKLARVALQKKRGIGKSLGTKLGKKEMHHATKPSQMEFLLIREEHIVERLINIEEKMKLYLQELDEMIEPTNSNIKTKDEETKTEAIKNPANDNFSYDNDRLITWLEDEKKLKSAKRIQAMFRNVNNRSYYLLSLFKRLEEFEEDRMSSLKSIHEYKCKKIIELQDRRTAIKVKNNPEEHENRQKLVLYLKKENHKLKDSREKIKREVIMITSENSKLVTVNSSWVCSVGRIEVDIKHFEGKKDNLLHVENQFNESIREIQTRVEEYKIASEDDQQLIMVTKKFISKSVERIKECCKNKKLREEIIRISKEVKT